MNVDNRIATRGIDVVFFTVKDMQRARGFYEALFDVKPGIESEYWVEYELPDGSTFALANDPVGGWHEGRGVMFGVPNIDEAVERALSLGATKPELDREFDSPGCRSAALIDTEDNMLLFHQRK
jgi:predicted enzyme related to lactoylglutathione lyase